MEIKHILQQNNFRFNKQFGQNFLTDDVLLSNIATDAGVDGGTVLEIGAGAGTLTKALSKELGPSGITVNAIAPGVINTDMNAMLTEEDIRALEEQTSLMRVGTTSDVAEVALFLASEGASFITGEVINVSGGFVT